MTAVIHINGIIGVNTDLLGVIRQFKSYKNPKEVEVIINSPGGSVDEGMSIYSYLRGLKLPITTKATKAYSIAASIFMAGDIRLVEEGLNRVMIHMPWGSIEGGRKQFEAASIQLKEIEESFIQFYSTYTDIDHSSIQRLLENETFMSAKEATELGIATGIYQQLKAVAFYNNNKEKEQNFMSKAEKLILKAFASFLSTETVEDTVNESTDFVALVLQDANGDDVEFPELKENAKPEEGAVVKDREGEVLMPDGSKLIIKEGKVDSIVPAPEDEEVAPEDEVAPDAVEDEVPTEEVVEDEMSEEDILKLLQELEDKIFNKVSAQFKEKEDALQLEIVALKKEVGSSIENNPTPNEIKASSKGGNKLTQALRNKRK